MTKKKTKRNVDKQNITHPTIKITPRRACRNTSSLFLNDFKYCSLLKDIEN